MRFPPTLLLIISALSAAAEDACEYVNPFIGTTNYGTCNPGAITPNGLMSVTPFNVMGSEENRYDKDSQWWSTPYDFTNSYLTGFSHVNLSGVGCPELGSLIVMPATGEIDVDYRTNGTTYSHEKAQPGYYSNHLDRYNILAEVTATARTSRLRFTPEGKDSINIYLNLGQGLTNETGASMRRVSDKEWEGTRMMGTFCYNPQAVFPLYFVMRVNQVPRKAGYWKMQPQMKGIEAQWDKDNGKYKLYKNYSGPIAGDDIGAWLQMGHEPVEVSIGVSLNSIEDARRNLEAEQAAGTTFESLRQQAHNQWSEALNRVKVEGGSQKDKEIFYTALYHSLIHPSLVNDVNEPERYSVFSLWDTYRTLHPLLSLIYPEKQTGMVKSLIDFAKTRGYMPRWELMGQETLAMEGDPALIVIADSYLRGIKDFDVEEAYELMKKSACEPSPIRPDFEDYVTLGYVPLRGNDNSVSHALEYYVADAAMAQLADKLGKKEDVDYFHKRSLGYKNYFDSETKLLRPRLADGSFLTPFNPKDGANFSDAPGYHEGSAWNYTFMVPHDYEGMAKLIGGKKEMMKMLDHIFEAELYDPANEPDIAYPMIYAQFGDRSRTDKVVKHLLDKYYTTQADGIPGNDDTGTMSAWAVWTMMGMYPDVPSGKYIHFTPRFKKVTVNGKDIKEIL